MTSKQRWRIAAGALALALVTAGCASDDDSSGTNGSSDDGTEIDASEVLGEQNEASGEPIKVGFIGDGQSAAIDNTNETAAAEIGADYVNTYLGGIDGRPIELVACETQQDPAVAADCGNQMVEEGVVAVLNGVSGQTMSFFEPVHAAGIPFVQHTAGDQAVLTDAESSFALTNPLAGAIGHPASIANEEGFTKVAVIVIDVPTATGVFDALGDTIFDNAGASLDVVAIPPGTADMSPQVQAALQDDPELIHVLGDGTFCLSAFQALDSAGYDGVVTAISNCVTDEVRETLPQGALEGVRMSAFLPVGDESDPTWQVYLAALQALGGEDIDPNDVTTAGGFAAVVGFAESMADASGEITPESVISTIKSMPESDLPVGGGITFQCNGEQSPLVVATCSTTGLETTLDADGQPGSWELFDPSDVLG
jgi:branched-chain amino acid transport system substrate-binding protein